MFLNTGHMSGFNEKQMNVFLNVPLQDVTHNTLCNMQVKTEVQNLAVRKIWVLPFHVFVCVYINAYICICIYIHRYCSILVWPAA